MTIFQSMFHPFGLVGLAVLDSSMFSFVPQAVEAATVILTHHSAIFWVFPFVATAGSMMGAAMTFWIGRKIGEKGLEHWISPGVLDRARRLTKNKGALALALPALLPPPFPLTPFVLACGALSVSATRFFITLASLRMLRFSIIAALAWRYGENILAVVQGR
jgi:membrane protein YqaA with SNARE-associated domain